MGENKEIDVELLRKIVQDLANNEEFLKEVEEFRRKHGTLTEEDLGKTFTI